MSNGAIEMFPAPTPRMTRVPSGASPEIAAVAASLLGAVAYSLVLYGVYLKKGYVLGKLDPLIQRLMQ